jgi:hypothetical protein
MPAHPAGPVRPAASAVGIASLRQAQAVDPRAPQRWPQDQPSPQSPSHPAPAAASSPLTRPRPRTHQDPVLVEHHRHRVTAELWCVLRRATAPRLAPVGHGLPPIRGVRPTGGCSHINSGRRPAVVARRMNRCVVGAVGVFGCRAGCARSPPGRDRSRGRGRATPFTPAWLPARASEGLRGGPFAR